VAYSDITRYSSRDAGRSVPRPCALQMATAKQQTTAGRYGKNTQGQNDGKITSAAHNVGAVYD
jgi:hypothetical protein